MPILAALSPVSLLYGQLSPGDLASAHAHLEGMSNCTQCHDLGKKVSNQKCLDCHSEIERLMNQNRGYHASKVVATKDCYDCHSDHHGRGFDMTRFDTESFDHDLTNYHLEGQHAVIDCRECHKPDNIADSKIRKRDNTYLGLNQECLSCHDDYHQNTLSNDCRSCHDMNAFRPAPHFDHNETSYKLRGQHIEVECKECHPITTQNGVEFQKFTGIPFNDCKSCHKDPHGGRIAGRCDQCHRESSFSTFTGQNSFNHHTTNFALKGRHQSVNCFSCHEKISNPSIIFQDKEGIGENDCIACHDDVHDGKFGTDCASCHQESSFLDLHSMASFNHNLTDYPLQGQHIGVDCRQCHSGRYTTAIDFSACRNCHNDYHKGQFADKPIVPDCVDCHTLEQEFDHTLYTVEQHQSNSFPLEGAHAATPCFVCHLSEEEDWWTFREIGGEKCVDCHQDIHQTYISEQYYPEQQCEACHINDSWAMVSFDHDLTQWSLEGKHTEAACRDCHFSENSEDGTFSQTFKGLEQACINCHEDVHEAQFAINGITDCTRCHDSNSWFPSNFDHDNTAFPLEGKHAEIECSDCHLPLLEGKQTFVNYKIEKFECIDCHQ